MRKKHKKIRRKPIRNLTKEVTMPLSDTHSATFTIDTVDMMEKMFSDWKMPTFSHQSFSRQYYYKTAFSYGDLGQWSEPQTESEKHKREIEDKLREFDSNIRKLSRQASKIGNRANRNDRIGKRSFKGGFVSKKSLDKERNTYMLAIENLKQEKEDYYDENLEYFI